MRPPVDTDPTLELFRREIDPARAGLDLARAHLALGSFEYPELAFEPSLLRLDELAMRADAALSAGKIGALDLARFLFRVEGFGPNTADLSDPRNSFLSDVLQRRMGIPITLSVIYLEVASRVGVQAQGIGLPGHFIVSAAGDGDRAPIYIDPYGGVPLSVEDCIARVSDITVGRLAWRPDFLDPVGPRYILTRILNNLKNAYAARADSQRAARVVERLLVLNPADAGEWRSLGLLFAGLEQRRRAIDALERFIALSPPAEDATAARKLMNQLAGQIARLN
ncbi:MAG: transglutaminase-like domain-containing protein [Thermoflexales bacterium]